MKNLTIPMNSLGPKVNCTRHILNEPLIKVGGYIVVSCLWLKEDITRHMSLLSGQKARKKFLLTEIPTNRETDRHTDRQTDRQSDM